MSIVEANLKFLEIISARQIVLMCCPDEASGRVPRRSLEDVAYLLDESY
jgi:hypothetical protein